MPTESPPFEVANIVIKESAYSDTDHYGIIHANIDFVNTMLNDGGCVHAELPVNALRSYFVDYYLAQVLNGGLSQFVGNSGWKSHIVQHCYDGLKAMGLKAHYRLFRKLEKLLNADRARTHRVADSRGFGDIDPAIAKLDDKFTAQNCKHPIDEANAKWLKSLPELQVVEDARYLETIEGLKATNPLRETRLAARHRLSVQRNLEDNLQAAARLLCWSAWQVPVLEITAGTFGRAAPDGRKTIAWRVHSSCGCHHVYLLDDVAYFCDLYLTDGRRFTAEILEEDHRQFQEGNRPRDRSTRDPTDKEAAHVKNVVLQKSIESAKELQVATAADLLCRASRPAKTLVDVSAIMDDGLDFTTWAVATDQRVCFVNFEKDGAVLSDNTGRRLASVSNQDIQSVVTADTDLSAWEDAKCGIRKSGQRFSVRSASKIMDAMSFFRIR